MLTALAFASPSHAQLTSSDATDVTQTRATLHAEFPTDASSRGFEYKYGKLTALNEFDRLALSPFSDPVNFTTTGNKWSARTVKGWVESCKDLTSGQYSEMTTTFTLTAPATITFEWSVDSEENYGILSFQADNKVVSQISGSVQFTSVTHTLTAGEHTLKWRYDKKSSTNVGLDLGMVRNIHIANTTPGEWIAAEASANDHNLTNLYPSQTYLWRAYSTATDSDTRSYSRLHQFATDSVSVDSVCVTDITQTKARLTTQVNPGDAQVTKGYEFFTANNDPYALALLAPNCNMPINVTHGSAWEIGSNHNSLSTSIRADNNTVTVTFDMLVNGYVKFNYTVYGGEIRGYYDNSSFKLTSSSGSARQYFSQGRHTIKWQTWYSTSYRTYSATLSQLSFTDEQGNTLGQDSQEPIVIDGSDNTMPVLKEGLRPGYKYLVRSYIRPDYESQLENRWEGTYSPWTHFNTLSLIADTIPASNIKQASATINGKVKGGDATIIARGLQYRDKEGKRFTDFPSTSSDTLMSQKLTRLRPSTDYEYRSYIQAEECDTVFSPLAKFRTADVVAVTPKLLSVTQHTAKIEGKVISGDATIYQRGMQFRKYGDEWEDVEDGGSDSIYILSKTDLLMNQSYQARTYVQPAGSAIIYSNVLTFTTKNIEVFCDSITDIWQRSATIHGHIDAGEDRIDTVAIYNCSNRVRLKLIQPDENGKFTVTVNNLPPDYKSWLYLEATNTAGAHANAGEFPINTPHYFSHTLRATDITQTQATLSVRMSPTNDTFEETGFYYTDGHTDVFEEMAKVNGTISDSTLVATCTNLLPSQKYYFFPYVKVEGVYYILGWDHQGTFTANGVDISVNFKDITQTKATMTASVNKGDANVTNFRYSFDGGEYKPYTKDIKFTGLRPGTKHYLDFAAEVNGVTKYWSYNPKTEQRYSFTTKNISVSLTIGEISQTLIAVSWTINYGDATFVASGVEYGPTTTFTQQASGNGSARINELAPATTYYLRSYLETKEGGRVYSKVRNVATKTISCSTTKATDVSNNSAKFHGTIDCDTYSPSYRFGFQWKQMQGWAAEPAFTRANKLDDGTITLGLVDRMLKPDTDYQFRTAVMRGDEVVAHGADWQTFRTELEYIYYPGTVYTLYRTDRETNSIILCGYYVAGSEPVIEQGYDYWTISKSAPIRIPTDETMRHTLDISTLDDGNYQVRAFATTASGTVYGETLGFSIFNGGLSATNDINADSGIRCYATEQGIVIDNATGYTAVIMDVTGRQLSHRENMGIKECFPMAQDAIYIVKVSDGSVFKIKL